jgi:four helix bundle protein
MASINSYKELIVWQKSILLVKELYKIANQFPTKEQFILISQMLRAVISIPSNIAEGWARNHKVEYLRFLSIAYASSTELETQIIIAKEQYTNINYQVAEGLLLEVQKMLLSLMRNIKSNEAKW